MKKVSGLSDATTTASTTLMAGEGIAIESDTVKVEADVLADLNTAKSNITSLQATTSSLSVKNVLPNVWQSVIFWDPTAGIGNVPLTVDTSAGRPPYFELISDSVRRLLYRQGAWAYQPWQSDSERRCYNGERCAADDSG